MIIILFPYKFTNFFYKKYQIDDLKKSSEIKFKFMTYLELFPKNGIKFSVRKEINRLMFLVKFLIGKII